MIYISNYLRTQGRMIILKTWEEKDLVLHGWLSLPALIFSHGVIDGEGIKRKMT